MSAIEELSVDHDVIPDYVRQVVSRFQGVRPTRDGWDALCPCPDHGRDGNGDHRPSLRITLGDEGRVLIRCRVGCIPDAVLDAVGLCWSDLFPPDGSEDRRETKAVSHVAVSPARPAPAGPDLRHRAYEMLLAQLPLADVHRQDLRRRGLPDAEIDRRGYRTLRNLDRGRAAKAVHELLGEDVFTVPGFARGNFGVTLHGTSTGLVVPVRDLEGRVQALKIRREAEPKYVYLTSDAGGPSPGSPVHVPLGTVKASPVVRVTEGELKADVCAVLGDTPTVGVPGVTQWHAALPVLQAMESKTVVLAFDAPDVRNKFPVFEQLEAFWRHLRAEGFEVEVEDWYDVA
jgi:hypothetical protein